MKYEVVGAQRKVGDFTPKGKDVAYHYDNVNLHCVCKNLDVVGHAVREIKLKSENAADLIAICGGTLESVVGHVIDFEFGSYGKVVNYEFVK